MVVIVTTAAYYYELMCNNSYHLSLDFAAHRYELTIEQLLYLAFRLLFVYDPEKWLVN